MEKATEKQIGFIKDLSEKYQVPCTDLEDYNVQDADSWIKEVLHNGEEDPNTVKIPFNPVQYGLCLKLVYRKYWDKGCNPLNFKEQFIKEVKDTYILFEFK